MKSIYSSAHQVPKLLAKLRLLSLAAIFLIVCFVSCTTDDVEFQPKKEIIEESFLQRNDTLINDSIPFNNTNSNNNNDGTAPPIWPPINSPTPPKP